MKIIIIDDNKNDLIIFEEIINDLKYEFIEDIDLTYCTNPTDFLERIKINEYAIAFIDINMPQLNGFELVNLMPKSNIIKIINSTSKYTKNVEFAKEIKLNGYIVKSFNYEESKNSIRNIISTVLDKNIKFLQIL